jgi:hypothetical protein
VTQPRLDGGGQPQAQLDSASNSTLLAASPQLLDPASLKQRVSIRSRDLESLRIELRELWAYLDNTLWSDALQF